MNNFCGQNIKCDSFSFICYFTQSRFSLTRAGYTWLTIILLALPIIITFTVSAPRSIELNQDKLIALDGFLKVVVCQDKNPFILLDLGASRCQNN